LLDPARRGRRAARVEVDDDLVVDPRDALHRCHLRGHAPIGFGRHGAGQRGDAAFDFDLDVVLVQRGAVQLLLDRRTERRIGGCRGRRLRRGGARPHPAGGGRGGGGRAPPNCPHLPTPFSHPHPAPPTPPPPPPPP